jgi:hypothetical protein
VENNICACGFKFAKAGEFRNCEAFITKRGESGIVCPKCDTKYINGEEVDIVKEVYKLKGKKVIKGE